MIKCPNCGSTTQMRFIGGESCVSHIAKIWDCCGCKRRFHFLFDVLESKNNGKILLKPFYNPLEMWYNRSVRKFNKFFRKIMIVYSVWNGTGYNSELMGIFDNLGVAKEYAEKYNGLLVEVEIYSSVR